MITKKGRRRKGIGLGAKRGREDAQGSGTAGAYLTKVKTGGPTYTITFGLRAKAY